MPHCQVSPALTSLITTVEKSKGQRKRIGLKFDSWLVGYSLWFIAHGSTISHELYAIIKAFQTINI